MATVVSGSGCFTLFRDLRGSPDTSAAPRSARRRRLARCGLMVSASPHLLAAGESRRLWQVSCPLCLRVLSDCVSCSGPVT